MTLWNRAFSGSANRLDFQESNIHHFLLPKSQFKNSDTPISERLHCSNADQFKSRRFAMYKKLFVPDTERDSTKVIIRNHPTDAAAFTTPDSQDPNRLLRLPQVLALIPVSRSCWWQWVRDGKAPQPVYLGDRCTCWRYSDVIALAE
jgi:prophage regulatory protein